MRKYGRKPVLIYSNIPWIIGWIILATASDFWAVFFGAGLVGFSSGCSNNAVVVYVIEIAEPKLRGFLSSFSNIFFSFGIFAGHLFGILPSWRMSLKAYIIFPAIALLFSFFLPESPNWLIIQGHVEKGKEIFFWLRGISQESEHEYNVLLEKRCENSRKHDRGVMKNLKSRAFFRPFFIMVVMFAVNIGSGIDILVYYAIDILANISKTINIETVLTIINLVRIVASAVSTFLIKKFRRKPLFFLSTTSTFLFLIGTVLSIHFKFSNDNIILIISLCLYIGTANLGLVPIPWIMIAEVSFSTSTLSHIDWVFKQIQNLIKRGNFETTCSVL